MKVLSLGIGTQLFEPGPTRERIIEYGKLCDELHIVTYTPLGYRVTKLSDRVTAIPTNTKNKFLYFWQAYKLGNGILKHWKNEGSRAIITSQEGLTNLVALALSIKYKLGLEVQVHTDIGSPLFRRESLRNRLALVGYKLAIKRAKSVRVVSKRIAKFLMNTWSVPGKKITILPILVDKEKWLVAPIVRDLHKEFSQFDQIILMASRITKEKNFPLALAVFRQVRARYPKAGLVVVGSGPLESKLSGDSVERLPWTSDLASLYKSSDVFLLTSDYEGFGLTLVEAALCGLPIVTTEVGVVGEIINDHNALSAPPRDAGKLAKHLLFLLQNEEARKMMRHRLLQVAERLPDKETYLKLFKLSWQKCLS